MYKIKGKKGFTLVELAVVIAVLGIVAAIAIPCVAGMISSAAEVSDTETAAQIDKACQTYYTLLLSGQITDTNHGNSTQTGLPRKNSPKSRLYTAAKAAKVQYALEYSDIGSRVKSQMDDGSNRYVYDSEGNIYSSQDRPDLTDYVESSLTFRVLYNM